MEQVPLVKTSSKDAAMDRNENLLHDVISKCGDMVLYICHHVLISKKNNESNKKHFRDSDDENKEDELSSEFDGNTIGRRRKIRNEVKFLNISVSFLHFLRIIDLQV